MTSMQLRRLQRRLGYEFADEALLRTALTHRSAAAEHNERLEFLGDAVIGLVSAELLFHRFEQLREHSPMNGQSI